MNAHFDLIKFLKFSQGPNCTLSIDLPRKLIIYAIICLRIFTVLTKMYAKVKNVILRLWLNQGALECTPHNFSSFFCNFLLFVWDENARKNFAGKNNYLEILTGKITSMGCWFSLPIHAILRYLITYCSLKYSAVFYYSYGIAFLL